MAWIGAFAQVLDPGVSQRDACTRARGRVERPPLTGDAPMLAGSLCAWHVQNARIDAFYNGTGTPPPTPPATGVVRIGVGLVFDVL